MDGSEQTKTAHRKGEVNRDTMIGFWWNASREGVLDSMRFACNQFNVR